MRKLLQGGCLLLAGTLLSAGCQKGAAGRSSPEAALSRLDVAQRELAETQKFCPVTREPLGSMGTPVEIKVEDQAVLLCCEHCRKKALASPEKTLATVKAFKEQQSPFPNK